MLMLHHDHPKIPCRPPCHARATPITPKSSNSLTIGRPPISAGTTPIRRHRPCKGPTGSSTPPIGPPGHTHTHPGRVRDGPPGRSNPHPEEGTFVRRRLRYVGDLPGLASSSPRRGPFAARAWLWVQVSVPASPGWGFQALGGEDRYQTAGMGGWSHHSD